MNDPLYLPMPEEEIAKMMRKKRAEELAPDIISMLCNLGIISKREIRIPVTREVRGHLTNLYLPSRGMSGLEWKNAFSHHHYSMNPDMVNLLLSPDFVYQPVGYLHEVVLLQPPSYCTVLEMYEDVEKTATRLGLRKTSFETACSARKTLPIGGLEHLEISSICFWCRNARARHFQEGVVTLHDYHESAIIYEDGSPIDNVKRRELKCSWYDTDSRNPRDGVYFAFEVPE